MSCITQTEPVTSAPSFGSGDRRGIDQEALMKRLVAGDPQALAEIYDAYGGRCYALALRLIRDSTLAEDAVQEALLSLWRAPERFDAGRASLATYLLTLTHRRAVDCFGVRGCSVAVASPPMTRWSSWPRPTRARPSRLRLSSTAKYARPSRTARAPTRGAGSGVLPGLHAAGDFLDHRRSAGHGEDAHAGRNAHPSGALARTRPG